MDKKALNKMRYLILFVLFTALIGCKEKSSDITIYADQNLLKELNYGIQKLEDQVALAGEKIEVVTDPKEANLLFETEDQRDLDAEKNDGFTISKTNNVLTISSECSRGFLYGLLDIAEQLSNGSDWDNLEQKSITAHHDFRAIKFNLPWYSYRSGEHLSLHTETCKDLKYWESFLEMMVENKFNALSLWNMHPYMYMVKSESFPKASPFSDEEMVEWEQFWKGLFQMAKDRGIDTYIVNWNIFLPEAFSEEYGVANYSSEKGGGFIGDGETNENIEAYTREMVTLTLDKYENLTGIGLTLGERMGGMMSEDRKDWVSRTLIAGLKAANRKARLIYRAPLSAGIENHGSVSVTTEKITRDAIESIDLDSDVWVEFKFNWSHAHSSPKLSIVHGGMLTDTYWEPYSEKYKGVWTMRNEDFFVMRWGDPDFIRAFLDLNSQKYVGGCFIGSETYIPAKDFITKPEHRSWDYAFQRQWLFYKVWGNLLFNKQTSDDYFARSLADKFGLADGTELLEAWKLASKNPNRLASFFGSTWDGTLYSEGFKTNGGKFIDIDKFISRNVLDSSYVNIRDFVAGNYDQNAQITPLQLAQETKDQSARIFEILSAQRESEVSSDLEIELTDLEFWANYGLYFASKVQAGVDLERFRNGLDQKGQEAAVKKLTEGLDYWKKMVELAERYNVAIMPHQFDKEFSWRKHIVDVNQDIALANEASVGTIRPLEMALVIKNIGCFPADQLPEHITPLTEVGQHSEWSHDGKFIYYVDKAGGEVFKVDIKAKKSTQITNEDSRPQGHGYYRVYELSNGDLFFTCGPARHDLYIQILKKGDDGPPLKIDEAIDEGPAISRTDMKIVWRPDQEVIYSGNIVYENGIPSIANKTLIIDNDSVIVDGIKYDGILEPQNFRGPDEEEFTWTQYGNTKDGLFTSEVMGYTLKTGEITNYSKSPDQYSEPEGIFPGGEYTLIECDRHSLKGIKFIDVYKFRLDGKGDDIERLTFFNDLADYKGSNPVVSDDGKMIAFQAAYAKSAVGIGCGIYLFDLEKWEAAKNKN